MSKPERKGESKQGDGNAPDTNGGLKQQLSKLGSHSSMSGVKTIGESPVGAVRTSNYGTFNRIVLVAIDASPIAKYAFNCELLTQT